MFNVFDSLKLGTFIICVRGKPNVVLIQFLVERSNLYHAQMADQMIDRYRRESEPNA